MDILRGKIQVIDEILGMHDAIKASDRVEKEYAIQLEAFEKGIQ